MTHNTKIEPEGFYFGTFSWQQYFTKHGLTFITALELPAEPNSQPVWVITILNEFSPIPNPAGVGDSSLAVYVNHVIRWLNRGLKPPVYAVTFPPNLRGEILRVDQTRGSDSTIEVTLKILGKVTPSAPPLTREPVWTYAAVRAAVRRPLA